MCAMCVLPVRHCYKSVLACFHRQQLYPLVAVDMCVGEMSPYSYQKVIGVDGGGVASTGFCSATLDGAVLLICGIGVFYR